MPADHDQVASSNRGVVLLVEDNLHNRRIFAGILSHYGFEVLEAIDGKEGVSMAQLHRPDIIIMDLAMPVMDGWEATRRIKAIPELGAIPIIALTAHAMAGDEKSAFDAGCDGYLSKPISPKQLVAEVSSLLEKKKP